VVDQNGDKFGLSEKVQETLKKSGLEYAVFDGVVPDPPVSVVDKGAAFAKEHKIDGIAAIGGGSVLDASKAINILMSNPGSIADYISSDTTGFVPKTELPLILLPTTAGTGSEVSNGAVITDNGGVKKATIASGSYAVIDPELAVSLPPHITAGCGMDAFAHAAESLVTILDGNYGKMMAFDTLKRIIKWLPVAVEDGKNLEARAQMGLAAATGCLSCSQNGLNINHSCAHTLGAIFHLPHGDLCGICLPETVRRNAKVVPEKVRILGETIGISIPCYASADVIGETVASVIKDFLHKVGVKSLKAYGIKREDLVSRKSELSKTMSQDVCMVTAPTQKSPVESYDDIWTKFYDDYQ
jgi:alcohol dehydrogenase class IV